jgi:signal transduction histidine kinase
MPASSPALPDHGPALRAVATSFLRQRPLVVAPMLLLFLAAVVVSAGPRGQLSAVATMATVALSFFSWEAWRGRRRLMGERHLLVSLVLTLLGITFGAAATGGASSPLLLMAFAPAVVGFAAFGRGRRSNVLLGLAVVLFAALALLPAGVPFPPLAPLPRRLMVVVCGADALVLLRLGVAALTDAHAAARAAAASAGEDVVAGAAARARALEAMGARVAHEVRNPLSAIRALCEVVAEQNAGERKRLGVVLGEVERIDQILTGYLALARPLDELAPRPYDGGQLLREVAAVIEARAERAGIILSVEAEAVPTHLDPRRMKEALLNLVLNAIDATPAGGRIALRAATSGARAVFTVEDSGPGMPSELLVQAGTPFLTGRSGGTGLGLALCRQAIEQHGGTLELESAAGRGTTARVTLPETT